MGKRANPSEVSCQGKDRLTAIRAQQIANDMRRRGRQRIDAYHCPHCSAWHVGGRKAMPDARKNVQKDIDRE